MSKFLLLVLTIAFVAVAAMGQAPTLRIVATDPSLPADLFYGNTRVKPLRLRPGTNQPITIDDSDFFVSEHYVDFLSRFPDAGGFQFWTAKITNCGTDSLCILNQRMGVSSSFFLSQEFQESGAYVYRFYKGALTRDPFYSEFVVDRPQVVGGTNLEAARAAYAEAFTQKPAFLTAYPTTMDNTTFVTTLIDNIKTTTGVDLTSQQSAILATLNGPGGTRGKAVRQATENPLFVSAAYNPSFVLMEYFGYLKRDPDVGGYNFWLNILNNKEPNNFLGMVCSFVTSAEYQLRFGNAVTHFNSECPNVH